MTAKEALITHAYLLSILDYNPITGVFTWRWREGVSSRVNAKKAGKVAGSDSRGYISIRINCRLYMAHRLAWFYVYGEWPELHIDHIDTNRSNNRINNLRAANITQNGYNRIIQKNNKCGLKGVIFTKGKWRAQIGHGGKGIYLGSFDTKDMAYEAYSKALYKYAGEFARLTND